MEALILAANRPARRLFASVAAEREIPTRTTVADGVVELLLDL